MTLDHGLGNTCSCISQVNTLASAPASKQFFFRPYGNQNRTCEEETTKDRTSQFPGTFGSSQNCGQMRATHCTSILRAAKPSQLHYNAEQTNP